MKSDVWMRLTGVGLAVGAAVGSCIDQKIGDVSYFV
jgi:hypothetical protein